MCLPLQMTMGYACLMVLLYPVGVPLLYAYLLFYKHRIELQLLRSLELRQVALRQDLETAMSLASARSEKRAAVGDKDLTKQMKRKQSIKFAVQLAATPRNSRLTARDIRRRHSTRGALTEVEKSVEAHEQVKRVKAEIEQLKAEEDVIREILPDYVQKVSPVCL
jgi:hypothetical protein